MPAPSRLGDDSHCERCKHDCGECPHEVTGPAIEGSPDTVINGRPALRVGDHGEHAECCGDNTWEVVAGAPTVLVNGKPLARIGDDVAHCGGDGKLVEGSADVDVGEPGEGAPPARPHDHPHAHDHAHPHAEGEPA